MYLQKQPLIYINNCYTNIMSYLAKFITYTMCIHLFMIQIKSNIFKISENS